MKKFLFTVLFMMGLWASAGASENIFFESATGPFDDSSCCGSLISKDQFIGVSFNIQEETRVDALGGHFNDFGGAFGFDGTTGAAGSVFGAIVNLDGNDLPVGDLTYLENVVAYTVFTPTSGADYLASINVNLLPGNYGLIFGSGLFGAQGKSTLTLLQPDEGETSSGTVFAINDSSYPQWGIEGDEPNRYRMFLTGSVISAVPEPASYLLFSMGLAFIGVRQQRRQIKANSVGSV